MQLYCEDILFLVATHGLAFLKLFFEVSSSQCHHRGGDEEDGEACRHSPPSCSLSSDASESCGVQLGRMSSLSLTSVLFQRRAESLFLTVGAPTSSSLSPCQRDVMESDFRTVRRLIPFVPPQWAWKQDDRGRVQMSFGRCRTKTGPQWLRCWF